MIKFLKKLFGIVPQVDFAQLYKDGAIIIDVRSKGEYAGGHIKNSQNIPLNNLPNHFSKLNKDSVIITCCASGMRSAQAKSMLLSNGLKTVYNGGGWISLQRKIQE